MTTKTVPISMDREIALEQQRFMTKVYGWMSLALTITGLVAMWVSSTPNLVNYIFNNQVVFIGLLILELLLVAGLASLIRKISAMLAFLIFLGYSALNGVTLSAIFIVFTRESLASTFYITAGTFGIMSIYGYFTKTDLTKLGNFLFMGLVGLIMASLVNMFFNNETMYWITTYIGVLVFVGLTAFDTQKIKTMNVVGEEGSEENKKIALLGALTLYLDFINLFLYLLRIFGKRN